MTTEEKLKDLILRRYHSIREFTIEIDMPYTTMDSIFRRGIGNSSVSNIIKICKALKISADALADGEIRPVDAKIAIPIHTRFEVQDVLANTKDILTHSRELTLDGETIQKEEVGAIIDAMEVGVEIARRKKNS